MRKHRNQNVWEPGPVTYHLQKMSLHYQSFHYYMSQMTCSLEEKSNTPGMWKCFNTLTRAMANGSIHVTIVHGDDLWPPWASLLSKATSGTVTVKVLLGAEAKGPSRREAGGYGARRRERQSWNWIGAWRYKHSWVGTLAIYIFFSFGIIPWEQKICFQNSAPDCTVVFVRTIITSFQWISCESQSDSRLDQRWIHVQRFK